MKQYRSKNKIYAIQFNGKLKRIKKIARLYEEEFNDISLSWNTEKSSIYRIILKRAFGVDMPLYKGDWLVVTEPEDGGKVYQVFSDEGFKKNFERVNND